MKKIEFGSDDGLRPTGSWKNLGLANGVVSGELIGLFNFEDEDYIVTKVGNTFPDSKYEANKMMVSRAVADLYKDGSGNIFIDQAGSLVCKDFEELLNSEKARTLLERGVSITDICNGYPVSNAFRVLVDRYSVNAVAINHEVFENKKRQLSQCHSSFSDIKLQQCHENDKWNHHRFL